MSERAGRHIVQKHIGESYKVYVPKALPPNPPLDLNSLYPLLEKATRALAELNIAHKAIPNTSLFIYMYVRKEALLSSQIEGTQSSFSDLILFENNQKTEVSIEDVEEVSNYVAAINYGLERLKQGFPLSLRLLREIHGVLLSGGRGANKLPGEFRRSQNWIGGTRPGNALFVPPSVDYLEGCLGDLENFLYSTDVPVLIKAGLAHVQFETIHPFLDGNGRLGRLLIILILCHEGVIDEPILYLSLYLKQNRKTYYSLLQEVRDEGKWEVWLEFFLEGIIVSARQAINTAKKINELFIQDVETITHFGRVRFSCEAIIAYMRLLPQVTVPLLSKELNISAPTARSGLNSLVDAGIIEEVSGKRRDKIYIYRKYLNILEEGTEPIQELYHYSGVSGQTI